MCCVIIILHLCSAALLYLVQILEYQFPAVKLWLTVMRIYTKSLKFGIFLKFQACFQAKISNNWAMQTLVIPVLVTQECYSRM